MASVSRDPNGTKRILFTDGAGDRRAVRLGKASTRTAQTYREKIEKILEARFAATALDAEVAKWLADVPDVIHGRLVAAGLAESRVDTAPVTLGGLLTAFFAGVDVKPATKVRMEQAKAA